MSGPIIYVVTKARPNRRVTSEKKPTPTEGPAAHRRALQSLCLGKDFRDFGGANTLHAEAMTACHGLYFENHGCKASLLSVAESDCDRQCGVQNMAETAARSPGGSCLASATAYDQAWCYCTVTTSPEREHAAVALVALLLGWLLPSFRVARHVEKNQDECKICVLKTIMDQILQWRVLLGLLQQQATCSEPFARSPVSIHVALLT